MTPTPKTYWYFIQARSHAATAAICLRAGHYNTARKCADNAKEFWHKVEWSK